jgi:uncharacterized protein YdeI (YjbR/CyaY-like superfamily)
MEPVYFASSAAWRARFQEHHATATEVWIGYFKAGSGRVNLTWQEAVREALCFGWIDGQRRPVDDDRTSQRFTPRKPRSRWSAVNVRHVEELEAAGLMHDAGRAAFAARDPDAVPYSLSDRPAWLPDDLEATLRADPAAAAFWDASPPSYRKAAAFWVTSAKRDQTRAARLATLIADCAAGLRLKQMRRR